MAYIYHITFDIHANQMDELRIGGSLERVLGYLRTLLPEERGFITSRALYSVEENDLTHIIFMSEWQTWEDLQNHKNSNLIEEKILKEFEPHVNLENLTVQIYGEVD
jgi:hypothetical protein